MKRRIREAIVGVTAAIVLLLGLPLAIAVHRLILDAEVVELQATATRTLAEISLPLDRQELAAIRRESDAPPPFTVYDERGQRLFGPGPARADALVRRALAGNLSTSTDGAIIAAAPIADRTREERIVGAVQLSESLEVADQRSRVAWLIMAVSAGLALGLAWLIANRLARRLSQPLSDLAAGAGRIGDGGSPGPAELSGISEIDELSLALSDSTERVHEALGRERRFGADVSHQLRTPITALRLRAEGAQAASEPLAPEVVLAEVGRLEETVAHLLAVARDAVPAVAGLRLDEAARAAADRWQGAATSQHRQVVATVLDAVVASGSDASVTQILDVLVDNALRHGAGTVELQVRSLPGGAAVDVLDEGSGIGRDDALRIFARGHGHGLGIGLALGRSLAEADGGRLVLAHLRPTTFSLLLAKSL